MREMYLNTINDSAKGPEQKKCVSNAHNKLYNSKFDGYFFKRKNHGTQVVHAIFEKLMFYFQMFWLRIYVNIFFFFRAYQVISYLMLS